MTTDANGPILDVVRSAHGIIAMLPPSVHAEVIEGEVIPAGAFPVTLPTDGF
jgi:hypothetical protein